MPRLAGWGIPSPGSKGWTLSDTQTDGGGLLELVWLTGPDVVLVDIFIPPVGGLAVISAVNLEFPDTRIVVLPSEACAETVQAALTAGACAVLTEAGVEGSPWV